MNEDERTVWCGNLAEQVTEELIYELFLQAAPIERVRIPTDREGRKSSFAFVTMKHEISVNYAVQLLNGTSLFDKRLNIRRRHSNVVGQQQQQHGNSRDALAQQMVTDKFTNLLRMGQLMQLNSSGGRGRHGGESNRRQRDEFKPHHANNNNKHQHHHSHGNSNRQGRNNRGYGDRRPKPY